MQDSWKQLKSDSTSWQNILTSSYNLQNQWHVVSIVYHEMTNQLTRKVGFEGNTQIGPVLEVTTSYLQGKHGVEIKNWICEQRQFSLVGQNFSWIEQVGHRLDRQRVRRQRARDLWDEDGSICVENGRFLLLQADQRLKQNQDDLPMLAHLQELYLFVKEYGLILNQELNSIKRTQWQKKLNTILRHGELPREEDGVIEFWRLKDDLRNRFEHSPYWSDDVWKNKMAGGGGNNKRFQYCTDPSGQEILYLRALQGHSGRNSIDPSLQDNVLIPNNFFEYICHIGCAVNLHSIKNSGLIVGAQNSSKDRQTVFFTAVNPMHKKHHDPKELDLTKPRLASYKQKKWKVYQDTVYWVDTQLAQRKGLKFHQTKSNAIILFDTLPAHCLSKVVVMEPGEIIYEIVYESPRPPPNISGSSKDTQRIQPKTKTQLSRTVRLVGGQESTKEIEKDILFGHEDIKHSTRTWRPVSGQKSTKVEELDIAFRGPGLSRAVVKEAEHFWVQELVKKIESHPHREALQADLQLNNVYNSLSNNSKAMIRALGNVELSELCETTTKVQSRRNF